MPFNTKKILKLSAKKPKHGGEVVTHSRTISKFGPKKGFKGFNKKTDKFVAVTTSLKIVPIESVVPKHFCRDCIFYDFANRMPDGSSVCNHDKFLGQKAALVRVDEKKCGIDGKYFKDVGPKDSDCRKLAIQQERKAIEKAAKEARAAAKTKGKGRGKFNKKEKAEPVAKPAAKPAKTKPKVKAKTKSSRFPVGKFGKKKR